MNISNLQSTRQRACLLIDEAQEMHTAVLSNCACRPAHDPLPELYLPPLTNEAAVEIVDFL